MYEDYSVSEIKKMVEDCDDMRDKLKPLEIQFLAIIKCSNYQITQEARDKLIQLHNGIAENNY